MAQPYYLQLKDGKKIPPIASNTRSAIDGPRPIIVRKKVLRMLPQAKRSISPPQSTINE